MKLLVGTAIVVTALLYLKWHDAASPWQPTEPEKSSSSPMATPVAVTPRPVPSPLTGASLTTHPTFHRTTPAPSMYLLEGKVRQHLPDGSLHIDGARIAPRLEQRRRVARMDKELVEAGLEATREEFILVGLEEAVPDNGQVSVYASPAGTRQYTTVFGATRTVAAYHVAATASTPAPKPGEWLFKRGYVNPLEPPKHR